MSTNLSESGNSSTAFSQLDLEADVLVIGGGTSAATVPGLYAASDAATRELICGGFTGSGSHNAAWATSSGYWAGKAAANYARQCSKAENSPLKVLLFKQDLEGSKVLDTLTSNFQTSSK